MNNTTCLPDNFSIPCGLDDEKRECDSCKHAIFASYIVIVILSPVAGVGNALILAAIWKKTFQRTPFHILLSGLAVTDLCTGLITQPFLAVNALLYFTNPRAVILRPVLIRTTSTIGNFSLVYSGAVTLLIITLMSIERWLHMSRWSSVTSHRGCLTATVLLLIPIPLAVFTALNAMKRGSGREVNAANVAFMLVCYVTTSITYFKVFRIIRQHQQQVQVNSYSENFGQPAINLAKYKRSVVSILYILALFSFCFLPINVSLAADSLEGDRLDIAVALSVSLVPLFLSSSLNPCLYLWRMRDVRSRVKQLFCSIG